MGYLEQVQVEVLETEFCVHRSGCDVCRQPMNKESSRRPGRGRLIQEPQPAERDRRFSEVLQGGPPCQLGKQEGRPADTTIGLIGYQMQMLADEVRK